jgi:nucleoside-diphosphate-sugar epimerase
MPDDGGIRFAAESVGLFVLRILLTGAGGFTGIQFAALAKGVGHEVVNLQANLTNADMVRQEVAQVTPQAVVHLAAISFVGHADESAFYGVNVVGTTNLLAALTALAPHLRPRKVLLASSANVYGNCEASPITELQAPAPVNHYAASKLAMEHMAATYFNQLPIMISRPFNYTGAGQAASFVIPKIVAHFADRRQHLLLGNLHVEREYNDVVMVCAAYLQLLEYGEAGEIYNVCSGQTYTLQQVIGLLADITGHALRVEVSPAFVRASEVHRLCGDPAKLQSLLARNGVSYVDTPLEVTLKRMLGTAELPIPQ